jgi:hypothetical protein
VLSLSIDDSLTAKDKATRHPELGSFIPVGYPVYVLFDSWYASAKLIKWCRRHNWHVICAYYTIFY